VEVGFSGEARGGAEVVALWLYVRRPDEPHRDRVVVAPLVAPHAAGVGFTATLP